MIYFVNAGLFLVREALDLRQSFITVLVPLKISSNSRIPVASKSSAYNNHMQSKEIHISLDLFELRNKIVFLFSYVKGV